MLEAGGLEAALRQITAFLDRSGLPYMVIGGIANLVWGRPRSTQDIDITVLITDPRLDKALEALGREFQILTSDAKRFLTETHVLPVATSDGTRVDLIRAVLPFEERAIHRAVPRTLGSTSVKVATAEDLVVLKLASTRFQDIDDAVEVIKRQKGSLDRNYLDPLIHSLSDLLERAEIWDIYAREMAG